MVICSFLLFLGLILSREKTLGLAMYPIDMRYENAHICNKGRYKQKAQVLLVLLQFQNKWGILVTCTKAHSLRHKPNTYMEGTMDSRWRQSLALSERCDRWDKVGEVHGITSSTKRSLRHLGNKNLTMWLIFLCSFNMYNDCLKASWYWIIKPVAQQMYSKKCTVLEFAKTGYK